MTTQLNKEQDALHLEIGRAITAWSSLEDELFLCYLAAHKTSEVVLLSASYHALASLKMKRDMINDVMQYALGDNPDSLKEWKRLNGRLKNLGTTRTQIAHYPMVAQMFPDNTTHMVLRPSMYNVSVVLKKLDKQGNKLPRLDIKKVDKAGKDFFKLSRDLAEFHRKLNPDPSVIPHNLNF